MMVEDTSDRLSDGYSVGSAASGGAAKNTFFGSEAGSDDPGDEQEDPGTGSGNPQKIIFIIIHTLKMSITEFFF